MLCAKQFTKKRAILRILTKLLVRKLGASIFQNVSEDYVYMICTKSTVFFENENQFDKATVEFQVSWGQWGRHLALLLLIFSW